MEGFLYEVAQDILTGKTDLRSQCIIVPNRRTGLFLRKEIISIVGKTSWMPEIITIKEIFETNSDLNIAEDLLLINKLYSIFVKHTDSKESFDEFFYWGEIILSDFDDLDKYQADANRLFSTIRDLSEIDKRFEDYDSTELEIIKRFWSNVNNAELSIHKQRFLDLWSKMSDIYNEFRDSLLLEKLAYQGLLYRTVASNPKICKFEKKNYAVVGFNALNKCEKSVLRYLKSVSNTEFYWDSDDYYVKNEFQEAGRFLRDNIKMFGSKEIGSGNKISKKNCNVEVIMAPSPVSQVKLIDGILNEWKTKPDFDPEKIAIVLGDENLLIPLMYSIPPYVGEYNVSMGFPVKNSASFGFVSHLVSLKRNQRASHGKSLFYYKDVLALVNHSFLQKLFPEDCMSVSSAINTGKLIYSNPLDIVENSYFVKLFDPSQLLSAELSLWFAAICSMTSDLLSSKEEFATETEFMLKICTRINVVCDCIVGGQIRIERKDILFKIMLNSLRTMSLAFEGEPLSGMQVLGFLETRNLDFDRVIMLSLNEGVFPKKSASQSLIPYNLRKFYELPSIEFQDSIFAYYFYRLLQRSKEVKILYSAQAGDGSSEVSRFVSQIKFESGLDIKFKSTGYKINLSGYQTTYASGNDDDRLKMKDHLLRGISPTALNMYLNCKFKYYLQYIKNIREPDKTEEAEDSAFFGRLFHSIMKQLYLPYLGKVINVDDFKTIASKENLTNARLAAITEVFNLRNQTELEAFDSKLIIDIVMKYVVATLNYDRDNGIISILGLEDTHLKSIEVVNSESGEKLSVLLKGDIDRVDLHDGKVRVIDYKTGKSDTSVKGIAELFSEDRDHNSDIATQVFIYSLMLREKNNSVCPAVFNINELSNDYDFRFYVAKEAVLKFDGELEREFLDNLKELFAHMLFVNGRFEQTQNCDNCKFCIYKGICER